MVERNLVTIFSDATMYNRVRVAKHFGSSYFAVDLYPRRDENLDEILSLFSFFFF